jgi:hypothetical protein
VSGALLSLTDIPRGPAADRGFDLEAPPQLRTCLSFSFLVPTGHHRRGTRSTLLPFASTSHGDDEVYLFSSMSRRAILGTLPACMRSLAPYRLSLSRHATCHGGRLGGRLSTDLGIEGAPAVPHHFVRVGSRSTGCSNSHRFSSRVSKRFGCSSPLCLVSLLTRKPNSQHTGAHDAPRHVGIVATQSDPG